MEETKTDNKPYEYYILLPLVLYYIEGKGNLKNYYTYLYEQYIKGEKILPDYLEPISIDKDVMTVKADTSAKIFEKAKHLRHIKIEGDKVHILISGTLAEELKQIAYAGYTSELPLSVYGIFNFYSNYVDLDKNIIEIYQKGDFDKMKDMINYIENKAQDTKNIYLLLRFPEYILSDAKENLDVTIQDKEVLLGYWKYQMNKLFGPLQKTIRL